MRRLIQDSRCTMRELTVAEQLQARMHTMMGMLADPDASALTRLKSAMALISVNSATSLLQDTDVTPEERYKAGVTLALELMSSTR
jgi:hypothetical protein